jgi:hypothetical protein
MNKVFDLSNDIFYSDTDSLFIKYDSIMKLEDDFEKKYQTKLIGD